MGRHRANDVSDSELWQEHRRAQQQRREQRLGPRTDEILALTSKGFSVERKTEYQFRVDGVLDMFPIHRRYHFLRADTRGSYQNVLATVVRLLRR